MTNINFYRIASSFAIVNIILPLEISAIRVLVIVIPYLFLPNFGKFLKKHMAANLKKVSRLGAGIRLLPAELGR